MTWLVVHIQNMLHNVRERQEGQTMAEYALILAGIAIVVIAGIVFLGPRIRDLFRPPAARSRARCPAADRRRSATRSRTRGTGSMSVGDPRGSPSPRGSPTDIKEITQVADEGVAAS